MNENQQYILEEEEEDKEVSQFNNTSDVFSLLSNIKQPQIIDEEAASQSELSPDAYALSEVIKQLLPLLNGSCELYSDLRQRFVEQKLKQFHFSIHSEVIADVEPNSSQFNFGNMDKLKESLIKIAVQLKQFKVENANAKIQQDLAVKQLQNENQSLREELSSLRQAQFVGSSSFSSPEKASSSQVTFQSMVITPRMTRIDQSPQSPDYSSASSSLSPTSNKSSLSPKPNNSSSSRANNSYLMSPNLHDSSSMSPRPKNHSSASPNPNNYSSASQNPNKYSSTSPKPNNYSSVSPKPNNYSSESSKPNNYPSASPKANNSSSVSPRPSHSSSVSPKPNQSSSSSNLK
ncbi:hypothetical protein M9Y10_008294 [Tritrichomonas musculus]|uniref:Uncharacterized protein n=1 Tax=Tritrichomonas musculus TaxID=1915356 RepID=A0ABR2GLQ7_9EUKA